MASVGFQVGYVDARPVPNCSAYTALRYGDLGGRVIPTPGTPPVHALLHGKNLRNISMAGKHRLRCLRSDVGISIVTLFEVAHFEWGTHQTRREKGCH